MEIKIEIVFTEDEPIYLQLKNRIIKMIANREIKEGDGLPSVRRLASDIGINMHTVNKVYNILKEEGFVVMDRRMGAVVSIDEVKIRQCDSLFDEMSMVITKMYCKNVDRKDIHKYIDSIYENYISNEEF